MIVESISCHMSAFGTFIYDEDRTYNSEVYGAVKKHKLRDLSFSELSDISDIKEQISILREIKTSSYYLGKNFYLARNMLSGELIVVAMNGFAGSCIFGTEERSGTGYVLAKKKKDLFEEREFFSTSYYPFYDLEPIYLERISE